MEQYALLRQKARLGIDENTAMLDAMANAEPPAPTEPRPASEWDFTVEMVQESRARAGLDARAEFGGEIAPEEQAYFKAVSGSKRGDSALTDELNRKAAKHAKRARHDA